MTDTKPQDILRHFVSQQPRIRGIILVLLPDFTKKAEAFQENFSLLQRMAPQFDTRTNVLSCALLTARLPVMKARTFHQRHTTCGADLEDSLIDEMSC